ncbi:MAG: HAMP domain-containing protein [Chloroflexi bacterium]|nr:HAMP domain-containing protein [Chloroflexota bacterium]
MTHQPVLPTQSGFISLRVKLLVGFTLIFTVVITALFYWFSQNSLRTAWLDIRQNLLATAIGGASTTSGDDLAALYLEGAVNEAGFSDDPRYLHLLEELDEIHAIEPRAWPYLYVPGEKQGELVYLVDLWAKYDPTRSAGFKEKAIAKDATLSEFKGVTIAPAVEKFETYTDQWGSWVSAYTPVYDSQGKIVGAMGVDFEADYVNEVKLGIRQKFLTVFLITYPILFFLVFWISRLLTRPIISLTQLAEQIGEGNYEVDLSHRFVRFPDEVTKLAEVFGLMVGKVARRESSLRKQVEELRIEIDDSKRKKQVSEIVESEFFRELQGKAQEMRHRRNS